MGTWDLQTPIRHHPKRDETTSKAHPKRVWMGILGAVTIRSVQCVLVIRELFTKEYGSRVFHSSPCGPVFLHIEPNQLSLITRTHCIVLLTKTGPRCISFRCKITVSLAQGAVDDAEADVADPVFVRSTIAKALTDALYARIGTRTKIAFRWACTKPGRSSAKWGIC